jgi:hypothetical protein
MVAFKWTPWWGTAPEWLAAIGTLLAFGVAFWLLRKELAVRRESVEDRRQAQASLVAAWVSEPSRQIERDGRTKLVYQLVTRNGSGQPIYNVQVRMLLPEGFKLTSPDEIFLPQLPQFRYEVLPPKYTKPELLTSIQPERLRHWLMPKPVEITFADAQGYKWRRDPTGKIHLLGEPPVMRRRSVKDRLDAFAKNQVDELDT